MTATVRAAIGVLLGVVAAQQFTQLPALAWALLLLPLALAAWRWRALRVLLWVGLGCAWAVWRADLVLGPTWPVSAMKQDVVITGHISGIAQTSGRSVRFRFAVDSARLKGRTLSRFPALVRLSWYGRHPQLRPGERWQLRVRLKPPTGFMNPGGFDYEAWLFRHGVRATGYVRPHGAQRLPGLTLTPAVRLDRLRFDLAQRVTAAVPDPAQRGVLLALTLGLRDGISQARWRTLLDTGTNHLVAISGLHVGLVAGLVLLLMRRLWSAVPGLALLFAAPRAAAVFALAAATAYAALAGFSVPTQRALIMLAVGLGGVLWWRQARPVQALSVALLVVLALDPLAVLDAGFWLSFAAVAVILYAVSGRTTGGWLHNWGRVQWALLLGLLPLTVLLFQRAAPIAPLANLLAVPWVGLIVVPLALLGTLALLVWPAAGALLLQLAGWVLSGLWPVLDFFAGLPWAHVRLGGGSGVALVFALLGGAWLLAPRGWPARWVGVVLFGPLLWPPPMYPAPGTWSLSLLDVGQGMAAVVQTAHHTLVFDAGPRYSANFNAGDAVVAPYLRSLGLRRLDMLVVSHDDSDHSGGVGAVLAAYPRTPVVASNASAWPAAQPCHAGEAWTWDGVRFEILSPLSDAQRGRNDRSCVLRIAGDGGSALLLSDIETRAERALVAHWGKRLAAQVMVVPHHGSTTSSSAVFLDTVHPQLALLSRGFGNRFGFPKQPVMARYARRGIAIADTAQEGTLTVRFSRTEGMRLLPGYRQRAGRYWNRAVH
ncbi:DNA internalization-related competence protein ComEC/Rec2 [Acidihalobacter ferrooxydans]|uniref:DNA internalization-related competence protein ComEC/Rec2 n=1 Tax=Acidihalobacter ferrooxydans TaxID=1765967 RepID=A0A1P8UFP7_9GAMM|nr:DNA internalization-related competence protein ComEC/Rec2 [Acidihalobacter ferrooxydans]APZ42650.1 DNA internalization-related competence protein ComEC/Rec2 [Acidihalobacter ferrooxydans]